ncbi:hypothetical protein BPMI_02858c [Candidatus Burkholderia pumila]|uniref:Uncharacterized protein n=1 Tax=Candidatus Burkholderia pumila TaxID=1090375 RepID=A0ABR5HM58_9BURK|nr:hypothetical protein BPMI_02858c [Candidatus Burkholderia pumila]
MCDYGQYAPDSNGKCHVNGYIPPEMLKKRLVVILNPKLNNGCLVVPILSKQDFAKEEKNFHVKIEPEQITQTAFYDVRDRWAKRRSGPARKQRPIIDGTWAWQTVHPRISFRESCRKASPSGYLKRSTERH